MSEKKPDQNPVPASIRPYESAAQTADGENQTADGENQAADGETLGRLADDRTDAGRPCKRVGFPVRGFAIVVVLAVIAIAVSQWFAPILDYQNANMVVMAAIAIVIFFGLFGCHRAARANGHRWRVPVLTVATIAVLTTLFRLDGFSGEMWPQLSFRFRSQDRGNWQENPTTTDIPLNSSDELSTQRIALVDSTQFLGPNRNGVIDQRLFSIPKSNDEVTVLWDIPVGDGWSAFAVKNDLVVTLEQRDEWECVTCYRLADGELRWIDQHKARHENPLGGVGPRSTPTIADGKVYAMGAMGLLRVLDLHTGKRLWQIDLLEQAGWTPDEFLSAVPWGHASSPLKIDSFNQIVISLGGRVDANAVDDQGMTSTKKSLIAMDATTGEVKWKAGRDQLSYASPMLMKILGQNEIVSVNEKTITGHDPETGQTLWTIDWPGSTNTTANCAAAMPIGQNRFVIGKGYGGGSQVIEVSKTDAGQEAQVVWASHRVLKTKFNHTCVIDGVGFGLSNGTLQATDLTDGRPLWNQSRRDRFGQGQVVLVEDVLVCQTEPGDVVFVDADPSEYRERGRLTALDSKTWNIPTIAGRHLLVRNDRQAICFLLPPKR